MEILLPKDATRLAMTLRSSNLPFDLISSAKTPFNRSARVMQPQDPTLTQWYPP